VAYITGNKIIYYNVRALDVKKEKKRKKKKSPRALFHLHSGKYISLLKVSMLYISILGPNKIAQVVALQTGILEVPASNTDRDAGYPD
jgi:hypothetical protein